MEHAQRDQERPEPRVASSKPVAAKLAAERRRVSAEALLRSLPEDIFEGFYYAAYYGDRFPRQFGGQRGKCERGEWFPLVASLFTNNDGMSLSDEAADAAHLIAEERGIVRG